VLQDMAARQGLVPLQVVVEPGQWLERGRSGKVPRVLAAPRPARGRAEAHAAAALHEAG
jgi:hypothetical protein